MTKTDSEIHKDVIEELSFDPGVHETGISVAVEDGVVTLGGHVPSLIDKIAAENAVKRIVGVKGLAQELKVELPGQHVRNDTDIAETAARYLNWDISIPDTIQVKVENGHVTLSGEVEWQYQRQSAEGDVARLTGVTGVTNRIVVRPKAKPQEKDIRSRIACELHRTAQNDVDHIAVEAAGGKVTLKGKVSTWTAHEEAARAAWAAPGVTDVQNLLTLVR